jgi:hypothetical protein
VAGKDVVQPIVGYFKSDQWHRFMHMLTQTDKGKAGYGGAFV